MVNFNYFVHSVNILLCVCAHYIKFGVRGYSNSSYSWSLPKMITIKLTVRSAIYLIIPPIPSISIYSQGSNKLLMEKILALVLH